MPRLDMRQIATGDAWVWATIDPTSSFDDQRRPGVVAEIAECVATGRQHVRETQVGRCPPSELEGVGHVGARTVRVGCGTAADRERRSDTVIVREPEQLCQNRRRNISGS